MEFNLERSSVTIGISVVSKKVSLYYRISSFKWGPLLVPVDKLGIKVIPEIDKNTNNILIDVEYPNPSINQPCNEAVIVAGSEEGLREYFKNSNVPFPKQKRILIGFRKYLMYLVKENKLTQEEKSDLLAGIQNLCDHKKTLFAFDGKDEVFTLCPLCGKEEKFLFTRSTIIKLKKKNFTATDIQILIVKRKRLFKKLGIE